MTKIIAILHFSYYEVTNYHTQTFRQVKNSFRLFLNRTSTTENGGLPLGISILPNQSKTVSLLQPSVAQVPLLLQPRGKPFPLMAHEGATHRYVIRL